MTNNGLPPGLIRQDILKRISAEHARAVFSAAWPKELRERWPAWMKDAIDRAEKLSAEAFSHGFENAVHELFVSLADQDLAERK